VDALDGRFGQDMISFGVTGKPRVRKPASGFELAGDAVQANGGAGLVATAAGGGGGKRSEEVSFRHRRIATSPDFRRSPAAFP
jgi:hypothetical protein